MPKDFHKKEKKKSTLKGNAQFVQKVTFEPLDGFKKTYGSWKYYKSCYFLKFSAPKLLKHTITFLWQCFLIKLMRQTLTDDFWGLRKNMNCAFSLKEWTIESFSCYDKIDGCF